MNLQLFSSPGKESSHAIQFIIEASRLYLEKKNDARVAYLPAGGLSESPRGFIEKAWRGLARVETLNPEQMTLPEMEAVIRSAAVLYIPDGNTFLLNHRLQLSNIKEYLRKKVAAGLPLVACGAGTILCGPTILTSNDMNTVESPYFAGLNLLPFNINCHYPEDEIARLQREAWLSEYHVFHADPIILLADGAGLQVEGKKVHLLRGEAWIMRKGQEKQKLEPESQISA